MRAAIYTRSATGNRTHLDAQAEKCAQYASERGYIVAEVYEDEVQSGMAKDGSALTHMISDANRHHFDAVVIEDVSRLSRRMDKVRQIMTDLQNMGITLLIVGQGIWSESGRRLIQKWV